MLTDKHLSGIVGCLHHSNPLRPPSQHTFTFSRERSCDSAEIDCIPSLGVDSGWSNLIMVTQSPSSVIGQESSLKPISMWRCSIIAIDPEMNTGFSWSKRFHDWSKFSPSLTSYEQGGMWPRCFEIPSVTMRKAICEDQPTHVGGRTKKKFFNFLKNHTNLIQSPDHIVPGDTLPPNFLLLR